MQEASQTLTFNSALKEDYQEGDSRVEEFNKPDYLNVCDKSSSSSSYHSTLEIDKEEEEEETPSSAAFNNTSNHEDLKSVNGDVENSGACSQNFNLATSVASSKPTSYNSLMSNPNLDVKEQVTNAVSDASIKEPGREKNLGIIKETNNNLKLSLPQHTNKTPQDMQPKEQRLVLFFLNFLAKVYFL